MFFSHYLVILFTVYNSLFLLLLLAYFTFFFFILKLFFHLMSFHPALPSHPVFHRGLNHPPFPLTQLFIVSPDVCTSPLCSTDTLYSEYFLPLPLSFHTSSFLLKDTFVQSTFPFLSNKRASLLTGDTPLSLGIPERELC